jgi:predicted dinucleotide-binding enzyme
MKIGILGAGNIASTVGALWAKAGHELVFATRHPETLHELTARLGENVCSATVEEAARFGEVVFCSFPYGAWPQVAPQIVALVAGKVVLDSANPYPARDGELATAAIAAGEGAGVPVAKLLPGARLVRAFNSVYFKTLRSEAHRAGDRVGIPLAGDDLAAVRLAEELVRDAGFAPVVVGALVDARRFDPGTPVYNTGMSGVEVARALALGTT